MTRISSLSERPGHHGPRRLVRRINLAGKGKDRSLVSRRLATAARTQGPWPTRECVINGTGPFPESSIGHLRESGLRENCTSRLRGGRRPALRGASSDPTPEVHAVFVRRPEIDLDGGCMIPSGRQTQKSARWARAACPLLAGRLDPQGFGRPPLGRGHSGLLRDATGSLRSWRSKRPNPAQSVLRRRRRIDSAGMAACPRC